MSRPYAGDFKTFVLKTKKQTLQQKMWDLPIVQKMVNWSRHYSPPGFSGIPIFDVLKFVIIEIEKDNLTTRAKSVSFSFFLSLFPTIIFLFTLLPLFPIVRDYTATMSDQLEGVLPKSAHDYIFNIIHDLTSIKRDGLLSLGALLALFFSSNGMLTLMTGFDKAYNHTFKPRHWLLSRFIAIGLTVMLTLILVASLVIMVLKNKMIDFVRETFKLSEVWLTVFGLLNWFLAIFIIYTCISMIYKFGPSMHRRIAYINVGSVLVTVSSLVTSLGFSYFINNFGQYNQIYGSIGALIVTMIWIQLNAFIILVGFEINASLAVHKNIKRNNV